MRRRQIAEGAVRIDLCVRLICSTPSASTSRYSIILVTPAVIQDSGRPVTVWMREMKRAMNQLGPRTTTAVCVVAVHRSSTSGRRLALPSSAQLDPGDDWIPAVVDYGSMVSEMWRGGTRFDIWDVTIAVRRRYSLFITPDGSTT